jgi:mRNA interferase RelE/StbE
MSSGYRLIYHKSAIKVLSKIDKLTQERFSHALKGLLEEPLRGDIKTMKGSLGLYRLQVKYRIIKNPNKCLLVQIAKGALFFGD